MTNTIKRQINILQVNTLNSNCATKLNEVMETINKDKTDLVVIRESNASINDPGKMADRKEEIKKSQFRGQNHHGTI